MSIVPLLGISLSVVIVLLLIFLIWTGRQKGPPSGQEPKGSDMNPFLVWGLFYLNPDDPRGWLPKRNPALGLTVNFRTRMRVYLFVALLLVAFGLAFLMAWVAFCR